MLNLDIGVALNSEVERLRPLVDEHITLARVRKYLRALADVPAPSTAASALRSPILKELLTRDLALPDPRLHYIDNFELTGNTVILTGSDSSAKPLWYFTHLDTISYLMQTRRGDRYPLVPFGQHLVRKGERDALVYRFDLEACRYRVVARGIIGTEEEDPYLRCEDDEIELRPGDRVVLASEYREDPKTGEVIAHLDNAGAVAALAVAAPVLARANIDALLAFPDEEEGPHGSGNQIIGRGGSRIVSLLQPPEIAIVADVQQSGGSEQADTRGGAENSTRLGSGAVLAEFASLGRGAVTPPHLYALASRHAASLVDVGVLVQESNNAYTSRSDDVSVMLRTPNVLLLGFPGFNRHFDMGQPKANLHDLVHLAKSYVYFSALQPALRDILAELAGG
ncbi:MAG: hypothetical protein WD314_09625 [Trueperaceae bacterium]